MHAARYKKLQGLLAEHNIDAMALIPSPSLFHLTDLTFHLMERPVIGIFSRTAEPVLFMPDLEKQKAGSSPLEIQPVGYGEDPSEQLPALELALKQAGLIGAATLAVEPLQFRFYELQLLQQAGPELMIVSAETLTASLRARKDPAEIKVMERAVRIAETALEQTLPLIKLGMSEQELQAELVVQLLRQGSQGELPFQPIVASGPNSAIPHAGASQRTLGAKEFLLIDWGARKQGYCSDLTRTFALAEADEKMTAIYETVLQANQAGREVAGPGTAAGRVDKAARDQIEMAGYGQYFTHRVGHGLGLEAHEIPYLYSENSKPLQVGMTFTVEPGIYMPEFGGVRIEDNLVITKDSARSLSQYSRELKVIA